MLHQMEQNDVIPVNNKSYSTKDYWEERYKKDTKTYDWFKEWEDLKEILTKYIKPTDKILMVGCGNSTLSERMYVDGFTKITNIDFSSEVIKNMSERCKDLAMPDMTWMEMDATKMSFSDSSFDVAIDKGTLDAVLTEQESVWEVEDRLAEIIDKMLSEVTRVLSPTGTLVYITFGQPHFRKNLLLKDKYGWELTIDKLGEFFHYFIYVLKKNPK